MRVEMIEGTLCEIQYKTGRYIAQFVERSQNNSSRAVVKIISVLDHPEQGDLHHPYEADVSMFHQRKASAYMEHVLIPMNMIEVYTGEVLDYQSSLVHSLQCKMQELAGKNDKWSQKSREQLSLLNKEYGFES